MNFDIQAGGGTGARFGHAVTIVAGVAALAASLLTVVSVLTDVNVEANC
jgi:hypothetical protein